MLRFQKQIKQLITLFLISIFIVFTANGQNNESSNKIWIGKSILKDQAHLWSSPFRIKSKDVKYLLPLAAVATTSYLFDENITKQVIEFREKNPPFHDYAENVTLQGETWAQGSLPLLFMLSGKIFKNEKVKQTGGIMVSSLINTQIITFASKGIFGRQRPDYNDGNDKWHWLEFGTFDSFFSGHSSGAWALATTIAKRHKEKKIIPVICYTLASSVSISRVVLQRHWSSDVLVGAIMGYSIASYTVKTHNDTKWSIFPSFRKDSNGMTMIYTF